jgi:hypothetical protein
MGHFMRIRGRIFAAPWRAQRVLTIPAFGLAEAQFPNRCSGFLPVLTAHHPRDPIAIEKWKIEPP